MPKIALDFFLIQLFLKTSVSDTVWKQSNMGQEKDQSVIKWAKPGDSQLEPQRRYFTVTSKIYSNEEKLVVYSRTSLKLCLNIISG